jgi:perosamine synthetase
MPSEPTIPLCEPHLAGREAEYLADCVATGWVSSTGAYVERFERELAAWLGGGVEAVALASGTAALHLALLAAGVGRGHEVVVPALTFIAPAFAVRYCGAWPVVVDVEPEYWQLDPAKTADFLESGCRPGPEGPVNRATGRTVRAILPVDLLGHPADLDAFAELGRRHGLAVIEDATESLGALYRGRPAGTLGDAACLSFNGNKLITTGGGGMLVTGDPAWARRVRHLSTQAKADPVEYVHDEVGYNHRLTNLEAAVGCAQLERISRHLAAKRAIARRYAAGLAGIPGIGLMPAAPWAEPSYWLYTVMVDEAACGLDSRRLMAALAGHGIQSRPLWQPLHQSPALAGSHAHRVEEAPRLHQQGLSLPCSVGLAPEDQERVIAAIRNSAAVPR